MNSIIEFFNTNHKYVFIAIGALIFIALLILRNKLSKGILAVAGKVLFSKKPENRTALQNSLQKPLSTFFVLLGLYIGVTINYQHKIVTDSFKIFTILIVCWSILCYISDNLQTAFNSKSDNKAVNGVAVKFISNILKVIIICIAVVMVLAELGYNINGLITGLGVGGLAVSLSAQDTLKNLISGFVILFDKPFDVGDLIETAEFKGVVEDITMRSTRIRKLDDSVIVVPNSTLSDSSISNYARLTRKLVEFKIGLLYSTPAETVKKCETQIKEYLDKNETVDSDTVRVYFTEYDESSINILIRCYICTTDIEIYYQFLEELNFEIKQIVESNKTDFAFPTRSIYIEKN